MKRIGSLPDTGTDAKPQRAGFRLVLAAGEEKLPAPMNPVGKRALALAWLAASILNAPAATLNLDGTIARPLRYRPEGTDFVIENGAEFFNRPLYGANTAFRVDGGDQPEFSLYLPGRGGNLRLGARTAAGAKWLTEAARVVARYRPGSLAYEISDPLWANRTVELTVLTLATGQGLVLRASLAGAGPPLDLIWAYGGANGERGRRDGDIGTENEPVSQFFQLHPEYCRNNAFAIEPGGFTLHGPTAFIRGVSTGRQPLVGDARRWSSAAALLASAVGNDQPLPVLVGTAVLAPGAPSFYLGLQRVPRPGDDERELSTYLAVREEAAGSRADSAGPKPAPAALPFFTAADLPQVFAAAEARRRSVAEKIVVDTPDPFLNAAASALCVAADGVWDEASGTVQHGAVAWRSQLLGWRGPYANDDLGWHDRAQRHFAYWAGRQNTSPIPAQIPPADAAVNLSRDEAALHSNGDISHSHYDMNLVYIDALIRHLLWTGDTDFARQIWPVIERHLAWERRLFRRPFGPDGLPLYEAYCCIWASDDVAYEGGGATHASAYNYYENVMAAKLARLLRADPAPYDREAALIWRGMHRELWLSDRGWFGEWKDLLGRQTVHASPALWTFYHTVDSGAATPLEAWQMTRFIDTQIAHLPLRGPGVPEEGDFVLPTTNWMPYTWSTNNVVMAENAHTALGYWQAGRPEEAYRLFKGAVLTSMFVGLCPGNAGMTTTFDMARGESQRDFADAAGTSSRALLEGVFGITPDALAGVITVRPGFPARWDRASLRHPDFNFRFRREGPRDRYELEPKFSRAMALRLQLAARGERLQGISVNGAPAAWRLVADAVGAPRIEISAPAASRFEIVVTWSGAAPAVPAGPAVVAGREAFQVRFGTARLLALQDPQGALRDVSQDAHGFRATVAGTLGFRTVFAQLQQGEMQWWAPVEFEARPAYEFLPAERQDAGRLRFRIRNNTARALDRDVRVRIGGGARSLRLVAPPRGDSEEIALAADGLPPGANRVTVELGEEAPLEGSVTNWALRAASATRFDPVDLTAIFNDRVTQIYQNSYLSPRSPYCSLAMPKQGIGTWCRPTASAEIDDSGLRAAARNGSLGLPSGVSFATPGPGPAPNIAFPSQWDRYPRERTVPLQGRAAHVYLLMAGSTNSMQSRCDNGEVIVTYRDGSTERLVLENPTNWWPIEEDDWIDDYAFRRPGPIPPRVSLRTGLTRLLDPVAFAGHGHAIAGGAATVLDLPLRPDRELQSLTVRALANEVVIGLMAATLAR
jgi:hypothetical protein